MEKFAAIDFERANGKQSSICSIGVAIVENGEITDRFYSLVRLAPSYYLRKTTAIHGLKRMDTMEALPFPDVWSMVTPKIEGLPLVAHNSSADEELLKAAYQEYSLAYPDYRFYCTLEFSCKYYPALPNHKLDTVVAYCGYELANHHHALADAEACARVVIKLMQENGVTRLNDL
ncbi:MAG: 3'-5' exonuclease [Tannerellaceae bacterium]|nr:3'-5' exonuclease [Tannerellaceae bacterium]